MKRVLIGALMACMLAFGLAGCGSSQPVNEDNLTGYWSLDTSELGIEAFLELDGADEDHTAALVVGGALYEGTWSVQNGSATFTTEDNQAIKLSMSGDKLVLGKDDGSKLVFKKSTLEEIWGDDFAEGETGATGEAAATADGEEIEVVDEVINDIEPVTIADDANCTITVTGKGTDFTGDPGYRMQIVNKGTAAIFVTAEEDFTVNGKAIEAGIGDSVEAGETLETFMYFAADDLGGSVEALVGVDGVINVETDEDYTEIASYTFHMD